MRNLYYVLGCVVSAVIAAWTVQSHRLTPISVCFGLGFGWGALAYWWGGVRQPLGVPLGELPTAARAGNLTLQGLPGCLQRCSWGLITVGVFLWWTRVG